MILSVDFPLPKNCSLGTDKMASPRLSCPWVSKLTRVKVFFTVTREVDLAGGALYKVNGIATTEESVKNLFLSRQPNVRNPYVLITKEDVTKALSMMTASDFWTLLVKDCMIGSTTRAVLQDEVDNIDGKLHMTLNPHMRVLQGMYDDWANEDARLLKLERYLIAMEYQEAKEAKDAAYSDLNRALLRIDKIDREKRDLEDEVTKLKETLSKHEYNNLIEKCDDLHRQVNDERAKESELQRKVTDKKVELTKLKHDVQHYETSIERDHVDYEFSAKAKELEGYSSLFDSPDKKKLKLTPNEAVGLSQQQQQDVAEFEDEVAQDVRKQKSSLAICESVLNALVDDLSKVEDRIRTLEGERKADVFLSKASNLRLQLLHNSEKEKVKIHESDTAKEKKQELKIELKHLSLKMGTMVRNYEWIEGNKDRFGVPGGEFDFKSMNFHTAKEEHRELLEKKAGRKDTTVREISEQIHQLQQESEQLEKKATELKARIKRVDMEEGPKLCNVVNRRFQRIVAALLPGVDAKLEVQPNASISEGLQVVIFRGADRQSLSQMPEGLVVAFSFLLGLSLQEEREATLYLLDLAHTVFESEPTSTSFPDAGLKKRFRAMISELFPKSQFIVTALSEESLNNADATFMTRPKPTTVVRRLMKQ